MSISLGAEKAFEKNQHPFVLKTFKLRLEFPESDKEHLYT
jgi:hypothetical protein